jgi:hypothetical protein
MGRRRAGVASSSRLLLSLMVLTAVGASATKSRGSSVSSHGAGLRRSGPLPESRPAAVARAVAAGASGFVNPLANATYDVLGLFPAGSREVADPLEAFGGIDVAYAALQAARAAGVAPVRCASLELTF